MRPGRIPLLTAAVLWLALPAGLAQVPNDSAVKARLAMAVARFAELPDQQAGAAVRFCVIAKGNVMPRAFAELNGQRIGGRSVEIVVAPPQENCDVLFVSDGVPDWRAQLQGGGGRALTIGDVPGFLVAGGMIELVIENDAMRFDVNLEATRQRRIRLPGQVLKLARRVQE